jgi:hypothetical protein
MRNTSKPAKTLTLCLEQRNAASWTRVLLSGILAAAALCVMSQSHAASALCVNGSRCADPLQPQPYESPSAPSLEALTGAPTLARGPALSDQEYLSFSGVGAVVCTVHGVQRMSTAFLVGAFDIGVTVAHTFEHNGEWAQPENCVYTTTDSLGQVRERIPVSYIQAQWESEAGAYGQPAKDFAVIRLSEPSRFAQRTMPLGKFSGGVASVVMIGFNENLDGDTVKRKTRGTVYERKVNGVAISSMAGFTHDMDSRDIASGAPVIDENTGVIIGIHTQWNHAATATAKAAVRNTMIAMNDWLERTLRSEMMAGRTAATEPTSR